MNTLPTLAQIDSIHSTLALASEELSSAPPRFRAVYSNRLAALYYIIMTLETWIELCDDELPIAECRYAIELYDSLSR